MNWFSLFFPLFINPLAPQNQFQSRLTHALSLTNIPYHQLIYRHFNSEVEFTTNQTKVIFSTAKNPYWQVDSLQQTLKIATIKGKIARVIDLSLTHPYATLQNH